MIFPARILLLACVAAASSAVEEPDKNDLKTAATATATTANSTNSSSSSSSTGAPPQEPKDVSILKQINKVNDDGSYTYGYEASDGSFKVETRDVAGNVKGMFGFVDEAGRLKRVSYSANNSSGFQTAGSGSTSSSPPPQETLAALSSVQTIPPRRKKDDDDEEANGPTTKSTGGVKKVLVSKRPIPAAAAQDDVDRRRGGNDLRRQLPANDDAPDVYGVHGRSSLHSAPVSPVVSALMSELDPIRAYNNMHAAAHPTTAPYDRPATAPTTQFVLQDTISRQAQDDDGDEPPPPPPPRYQQPVQQQLYRGGDASYSSAAYPVLYRQQQQQQQQQPAVVYGPNLASLRDELMELILSFVQARVSQLMPYAPQAYPMPYQQPNYYVPSYYQGPRVQGSSPIGLSAAQQQRQQLLSARQQRQRLLLAAQQQQDDDYAAAAAADPSQQQSSPRVTQTLKDGLIRMLLSTSPRYEPDRTDDGDERSAPRFAYRRTTQSTPVRNVQVIGEDRAVGSSRPVTTETPD